VAMQAKIGWLAIGRDGSPVGFNNCTCGHRAFLSIVDCLLSM
jgi:hypothetical protein